MDAAAGAGARAPAALRPPRDEHLWELAAGAERGAGAVQPTSGHLYNWKCFQEKKKSQGGGIFFLLFCFFVLLNTFPPPPAFPPSGSPDAASRCRVGSAARMGRLPNAGVGVGGSNPHPRSRAGGATGQHPPGIPHSPSPWHTWVPSPAVPSCEMGRGSGRGDTARGACGGQGICIPWEQPGPRGRGEAESPRPGREGSGGPGIATRPGKSSPTWAG